MSDTTPAPHPPPTQAVIVTHTHWDREWYQSVEETRFRLVELFDRLLDLLADEPAYHSFWMDGQTIPIEDYLAVRPERATALAERLRQNKIQIGPWYVLADEFLVSGEACIRNLLLGTRIAASYGQKHNVGYAPDTFGHIDQFPQILRGFGLDNAILWRGYSHAQIDAAETTWRGRDGSTVKALCLVGGYSNSRGITANVDVSTDRLDLMLGTLKQFCGSGTLLLMNGIDHALPLRRLDEVIPKLEARYPGLTIQHGDPEEYLRRIAHKHEGRRPLLGELFQVAALDGCLSNRPGQKRLNRRLENRLAHYAEPLALLANRNAEAIPLSLIDRAWRLLLKCHPHDTICGCHADVVAGDLETRLNRGLQIAQEAESRAIAALLGCRPGAGPVALPCRIAVYNPLPWPRDEAIELDLPLPAGTGDLRLADASGVLLPCRILHVRPGYYNEFHDFNIPTRTACLIARLRFEARQLAPMAVSLFEATAKPPTRMNVMDTGSQTAEVDSSKAAGHALAVLENGRVQVTVHHDGTLDLLDKPTGRRLAGLNQLRMQDDHGDLYRFAPSLEGVVTALTPGTLSRTDDTPAWQAIRVDASLRFQNQTLPVQLTFALPGEKGRVEITVAFENTVSDFRLQAGFPIPTSGTGLAHTPFSLSPRRPVPPGETTLPGRQERLRINSVSQPMQHLVQFALAGGQALALYNRGLYEYTWESPDQPCLTLMRGTGKITTALGEHRADGGQCHGPQRFEYALALQPAESPHMALREAFEYNLPPAAQALFTAPSAAPAAGFEFLNPHWIPSGFKRAESGAGHVLRFWNASETDQAGEIRLPAVYTQARRARLDETPLAPADLRQGLLRLTAKPFEIVTVLLA